MKQLIEFGRSLASKPPTIQSSKKFSATQLWLLSILLFSASMSASYHWLTNKYQQLGLQAIYGEIPSEQYQIMNSGGGEFLIKTDQEMLFDTFPKQLGNIVANKLNYITLLNSDAKSFGELFQTEMMFEVQYEGTVVVQKVQIPLFQNTPQPTADNLIAYTVEPKRTTIEW